MTIREIYNVLHSNPCACKEWMVKNSIRLADRPYDVLRILGGGSGCVGGVWKEIVCAYDSNNNPIDIVKDETQLVVNLFGNVIGDMTELENAWNEIILSHFSE